MDNETPKNKTSKNKTLTIFVYGTLKKGFPAHASFFEGSLEVENAVVRGSLFGDRNAGFPALSVPDADILAIGTANPASDAKTRSETSLAPKNPPETGECVHGEVFRSGDIEVLSALDAFEGFRAGGESLYERVLIPAWTDSGEVVFVWAYVMEEPSGERIPDGTWRLRGE